MPMKWSARSWWLWIARLMIVAAAVALARWQPWLLIAGVLSLALILISSGAIRWTGPRLPPLGHYQIRNPDAGRWVDPPGAELDKSTIGKLLSSRASRDPRVHVVLPRGPDPACTDALYDLELDG